MGKIFTKIEYIIIITVAIIVLNIMINHHMHHSVVKSKNAVPSNEVNRIGTAGWIGTHTKKVLQISIFTNLKIIWTVCVPIHPVIWQYVQNIKHDIYFWLKRVIRSVTKSILEVILAPYPDCLFYPPGLFGFFFV